MKVYLAGPIAGCSDDEVQDWRREAADMLYGRYGIETIDPAARDFRGVEMTPSIVDHIVEGDKHDIYTADAVLFNCWKPGWGTPMEMLFAYQHDKITVAIVPEGTSCSPWITYHVDMIVRTVEDAVHVLNMMLCST